MAEQWWRVALAYPGEFSVLKDLGLFCHTVSCRAALEAAQMTGAQHIIYHDGKQLTIYYPGSDDWAYYRQQFSLQ